MELTSAEAANPADSMIAEAGLHVERLETMYIPGPRTHSYNYWGRAVPNP